METVEVAPTALRGHDALMVEWGFLAAVWLLVLSTTMRFLVLTFLYTAGQSLGEARTCLICVNTQPPVTIAWELTGLAVLHVRVGIAFAVTRRMMSETPA